MTRPMCDVFEQVAPWLVSEQGSAIRPNASAVCCCARCRGVAPRSVGWAVEKARRLLGKSSNTPRKPRWSVGWDRVGVAPFIVQPETRERAHRMQAVRLER